MARLTSAIIGLGQVGMLFDEDSRRQGVWTHFTAYEHLKSRFNLIAVCEPDAAKREKALRRRPLLRAYAAIDEMMRSERLDVVSLCTPPALHARQILQLAGRVRGIICEKPLSEAAGTAQKAVALCRKKQTRLAVNFYKRYESGFQQLRKYVQEGQLGPIRLWRGLYSGPFEAVGSHLVDLFRFMGDEWTVRTSWTTGKASTDAWNADLVSRSGIDGEIRCTGPREKLIFELEAIGEKGRARVFNNGSRTEFSRFQPSKRYGGYQELSPMNPPKMISLQRFLPLFEETAKAVISSRSAPVQSDGSSALKTQQLMDAIRCR